MAASFPRQGESVDILSERFAQYLGSSNLSCPKWDGLKSLGLLTIFSPDLAV